LLVIIIIKYPWTAKRSQTLKQPQKHDLMAVYWLSTTDIVAVKNPVVNGPNDICI
jgi:hypothetical protein